MEYVHLVAVLAIVEYLGFGVLVGRARIKYGVQAPAMDGNEMFQRANRVHVNTLEQLVAFLPALYLANLFWKPELVAGIGAVYLVGRLLYQQLYMRAPARRAPGFILSVLPTFALLVLALAGIFTN